MHVSDQRNTNGTDKGSYKRQEYAITLLIALNVHRFDALNVGYQLRINRPRTNRPVQPRRFNQNFKCIRNLVLKIEFWILKFPWIKSFEKIEKLIISKKRIFNIYALVHGS